VSEAEFLPEIEDFDQKEFDSAKTLVQVLVKTLKSLLLYPKNNPIPKEFKKKLHQSFRDFLDPNEEFKLEVKHSQLLYREKVVYEDHDREEGMAYALHKDGVRELIFIKGLEEKELNEFLETIELSLKSPDLEDDLVTLLWEKDLDHIKYLVVDDLLDVDVPNAQDVPDNWDFDRLLHSEIAFSDAIKLLPEQEAREKEDQTRRLLEKLKEFSPEDVEVIHKLLKTDETSGLVDDFFGILGEILITEKNFLEFDELVERIESVLDSLVNVGAFDSAAKIIRRLEEFQGTHLGTFVQAGRQSQRKAQRIKKAIDQAGEEEKIKRVGSVLNEKETLDLSHAKEYLLSLHWNSISPILHMLRDLKDSSARGMVCEVLEEVGEHHVAIIGEGVTDSLWYVARNVALVLGRIGKEEGVRFLKKIVNHSDLRVRREVVGSLTKIQGKEAGALLASALDDPDKGIRILTCRGLAQRKEKGSLSALSEIIESDEFIDTTSEEKKQLLESLAIVGQDEVVPLLRKLIHKRRWLKRDKHNETRIFAVRALGLTGTPKADLALEELSRKRNKVIRQAAQRTLRRLDSRPIREKEERRTT
jgi:HEAT repeat protein